MTALRNEQALHNRAVPARDTDGRAAQRIDGARHALEGEIRDLVRRNVAPLRPAGHADTAPAEEPPAHRVNTLIQQVSGAATEEIDRVIRELSGVREMLRGEGDRVSREIAGYASLSHAAITSMRVIADSIAEWKHGAQHRHEPRS